MVLTKEILKNRINNQFISFIVFILCIITINVYFQKYMYEWIHVFLICSFFQRSFRLMDTIVLFFRFSKKEPNPSKASKRTIMKIPQKDFIYYDGKFAHSYKYEKTEKAENMNPTIISEMTPTEFYADMGIIPENEISPEEAKKVDNDIRKFLLSSIRPGEDTKKDD